VLGGEGGEMSGTTRMWNILSLGAGVQSSALALMAARGQVGPMPDAAIFADTQAEPQSVYRWLDWLEKHLPFPVIRVTIGDLAETSTRPRLSGKSGQHYLSHNVPAYTRNSDGSFGNYRRQCTEKHKITPLVKETDRLRGKDPATVWIGISWDEPERIKESRRSGVTHRWPLIEARLTRADCVKWMEANSYGKPPRSACSFCPYHSNVEWRRIRDEEPDAWADAVAYETRLQLAAASVPRLDGVPFLHPSRVPLDQVDLSTDVENGQGLLWQDFRNECEGMCGV
jgi:hypothetical protein